jgi:hypothetical protein
MADEPYFNSGSSFRRENRSHTSVRQGAGKTLEGAGRTAQVAGAGTQYGGKAIRYTGKGVKNTGKAVGAGGSALMKAGIEMSGTGVGALAGVPLAVTGGVMYGAGKITQAAGKTAETTGEVTEKSGRTIKKAGKNIKQEGKILRHASVSRPKSSSLKWILLILGIIFWLPGLIPIVNIFTNLVYWLIVIFVYIHFYPKAFKNPKFLGTMLLGFGLGFIPFVGGLLSAATPLVVGKILEK